MYEVEYGVVNTVQFTKKEGQLVCSLCQHQPSYVPCEVHRYLVIKGSHVQVFHIYKINDTRGNPNRPSFVFKTSTLKAKIAINMDKDKEHFLAQEFRFFDGKHKRAKGYMTLTASVYHPLLRQQIPLAMMEAVSENTENVTLFWELFNEVLGKVSSGTTMMFNPIGWCTDMAGSDLSAIHKVFGDSGVNSIKTCEFHFKETEDLRCRKLSKDKVKQFKDMTI